MKISKQVILRQEYFMGGYFWKAYFRRTGNRIRRANGQIVQARTKISDLRFDLLNNPMENGVVVVK